MTSCQRQLRWPASAQKMFMGWASRSALAEGSRRSRPTCRHLLPLRAAGGPGLGCTDLSGVKGGVVRGGAATGAR